MMPCDFCGTQCVAPTEYAVDPARVPIQTKAPDGRTRRTVIPVPGIWRACPSCTRLVEAGDAKALLDRGHHLALGHVRALVALTPATRRQFLREHRRGLVRLHARFWRGLDADESDDEPSAA